MPKKKKKLTRKQLLDKIDYYREKIDEKIINEKDEKKKDIAYLFEFENFMREQELYNKKYFDDLYKHLYPKIPEEDSKLIKRLSTILEYRIIFNEHYFDTLYQLKNNTDFTEKKMRQISMETAISYLDFYLRFYFREEYKRHKTDFLSLKRAVISNKLKDTAKKLCDILQKYAKDKEKLIEEIVSKALNKYESREFVLSVSSDLRTINVMKPTESLDNILKSYTSLNKIKRPGEYKSNAKQFINKLNELEWGDFIRIIETQVFTKKAQYWTEKLDEKFAPDLIKQSYMNLEDDITISKDNLITKNFINRILGTTMDQLDDIFYLKTDKTTTEQELYEKSNRVIDNFTLLKKLIEKAKKPYNTEYDKITNNIGKTLERALKSMTYFINEDIKCY